MSRTLLLGLAGFLGMGIMTEPLLDSFYDFDITVETRPSDDDSGQVLHATVYPMMELPSMATLHADMRCQRDVSVVRGPHASRQHPCRRSPPMSLLNDLLSHHLHLWRRAVDLWRVFARWLESLRTTVRNADPWIPELISLRLISSAMLRPFCISHKRQRQTHAEGVCKFVEANKPS